MHDFTRNYKPAYMTSPAAMSSDPVSYIGILWYRIVTLTLDTHGSLAFVPATTTGEPAIRSWSPTNSPKFLL
jgi:hypothetical protein